MRVVVTGASGFLGKKICSALKNAGTTVIEIDISLGHDITDRNCFDHLDTSDVFIHLAAKSFVPDSFENPGDYYTTNVIGTVNVLEVAKKHKARVLFFSSYLYGTPDYLPVNEEHPLKPHNPYAETKRIGELLCEAYSRDFGVSSIIFRPFNIYGPGQNERFLIPTILAQIETGKVHLLDGKPKRDYIHCDDVTEAVLLAVKKDFLGVTKLNIGSGKSYSVEELVSIFQLHSTQKFVATFANETRKNEVLDCYAEISLARKTLDWSPQVNLDSGIKQLLENNNG